MPVHGTGSRPDRIDARRRLAWLARQSPERWGKDFWPQPYERLAHVFREMGHDQDARTVLLEKESLQRAACRGRTANPLGRLLLHAKDGLLGVTLGYGRKPLFSFAWLFLLWGLGVRLSVCLEDVDNLIDDLKQALAA